MNFTTWELTFELLKQPIIFITILAGIICFIFGKKITGIAGERHVKEELKKLSDEYLIINDLMIKVDDRYSQIDHLIISKYGMFVIETKKYNGFIVGNDYDKKWIYKGRKTYYINNPVHQNYGHVQSLIKLLNLGEDKFIPIVSISDTANLKIDSKQVVSLSKLIKKIESYDKVVLENYIEIYNKLIDSNITNRKERKKHINSAKKAKQEKEILLQNKCPKCGGNLVERNGKYGMFLGCSNYPKCKYIKKHM